jgi:ribosome-binding protein aMBF1 (putative translation factor)
MVQVDIARVVGSDSMKNSKLRVVQDSRHSVDMDGADALEQKLRLSDEELDRELVQLKAIQQAAKLVKSARKEAGLSQAELASRVGSHQPTISNFENLLSASLSEQSSSPCLRTIVRLLHECGHDLELSIKKKV